MTDVDKYIKLKELLLDEDREFAQYILKKLDSLEETVYIKDNLSEKVNPIIDKKLETFVDEIPDKLGPVIAEAMIKSQDKIVDALYPVIGKLIKKYIQQEIKILSDKINNQVQNTFSINTWKRKFKSFFTGISENQLVLSELNQTKTEQVFLVEKGSGLLILSVSKQESIDQDMIAGMLTAIKSFVEDAIIKEQQSLELIKYEFFEIYIQNFNSYYFAVVISGGFDTSYKNKLENKLFDIATYFNKETIDKDLIVSKLNEFINND